MVEFFQKLFSTDFTPHAYCLRLPGVIQLHVWSDIVIAIAYGLIPISLLRIIRRRTDFAFPWMFSLFGLFIFSCGATHALAAYTLWHPIYRFDGIVKALTALVSLPTAILLIKISPRVLDLPSPQRLRTEIAERKRAEQQVRALNIELESRIEQRTRELTEAHALLAQSERRRLMAIEAAGIGTWFWNLDSEDISWDNNSRLILGLPEHAANLKFQDFYAAVHPSDLPRVRLSLKKAMQSGELPDLEYRVLRPDGAERWVRSRGSTDPDNQPGPRTIQGTLIDITEQKRFERALAQLASIVESSDDAIIGIDTHGIITSWNNGAENTFGYLVGEAVGNSISLLSASNQPDDIEVLLQRIRNGDRLEHYDTIRKRKDGALIAISLSISPIANEAGQNIGASMIARDITGRKDLDVALRQSEERFRTLAEAVPDVLFIANSEGIINFLSARFYQEVAVSANVSDPHLAYMRSIHPEDAPVVAELWAESVRQKMPLQAEFRMKKKTGGYRWVVTRSLPIVDERKAILQWIGASTDIDQLKRAEKALVQTNGELRQFAYAAAHDLQEPLRNIVNAAGMLTLRAGHKLDGSSRQYLQFCMEGAERMHGMVKDLLAFTTVVEGAVSPTAYAAAREVMLDVEANLALSLSESNGTIVWSDLPDVAVEPTHLMLLFQNIIGNALKYRSPDRPPIVHISAIREAETWRFEIADNGIGFKPEYKQRIFGVFKRLHPQHEYSGSGIGLAICARIVAHYGGKIWAEGQLGEGATFYFTLPAADANASANVEQGVRADAAG